MAAIVTDQFRILNAENFVDSVTDSSNSYYVFVGLSNPKANEGYGRSSSWDTSETARAPIDNIDYENFIGDNISFGRKITSANIRRVVRKIDWTSGNTYEMYRHDYSITNKTPLTQSASLYDADYYVMNSDYKVYICIDNGSSGINTNGNASTIEPTFTDVEPSVAGSGSDGYTWKFLFTVSPSDIIKFDSTEYITLPNNWSTSTDAQIVSVRDNGDSTVNENQIKKVYIENQGFAYSEGSHELNILGDGTGGKVVVEVNTQGKITDAVVSSGGKNYTYGIVDLGSINSTSTTKANLIPIIPPSRGHGYDIYKELGADKVLVYARFDDSNKDFPIDTKFAQIGILKNPTTLSSSTIFTENQFSSLNSIKFLDSETQTLSPGDLIEQDNSGVGTAKGYVVSYDSETKVVKYIQDRSLYLNQTTYDTTDHTQVSTRAKVVGFTTTANVTGPSFEGTIHTAFSGITTNPSGSKLISLGSVFENGLGTPDINKGSGDIIYIDNRPEITRNSRQKEDVKIILEF